LALSRHLGVGRIRVDWGMFVIPILARPETEIGRPRHRSMLPLAHPFAHHDFAFSLSHVA
jgi:hypothetical protein